MATTIALSLVLHLLFAGLLLPHLLNPVEPLETDESERDFSVSVVSEDELDELLREPPKPEPEPEPELEPEPEEERPEPVEITELPEEAKTVQQVTNEVEPDKANYVSDADNRTEEQTRARERTMEEVVPSNTERDQERAMLARASAEVERREERTERRERRPLADPSELIKEKSEPEGADPDLPRQKPEKRELFRVTEEDYERIVGHEHDAEAHAEMQEKRLLAGWEEDERIMRGALENFLTEVKPGNHTSVNSRGRAWANYLGRIHRKIHLRWANGYLASLDLREKAGSPLNDPTLNTRLEFVIRARDGGIERINIVQSSGELRFDAEAVTISNSVGPHPNPPRELVSPDGHIYVHWNFWRDQRQCGVFGASVYLVEKDEG